jgi:hypothetical protein
MKTALSLLVALLAATSGNAQIFRSHVRGSHHGDIHRHHHRPSFGIGYYSSYRPGYVGFGYGRGFGSYGVYRSPVFGYYPGYDYGYYPYANYGTYSSGYYGSANGATNGLLLGALAGGIIGHNSGDFRHNGWRGAAWGAGLGWLLGTVVDSNRRAVTYPASVGVQQAPAMQTYAAPAQQQPVTIINNYYNTPATPMSAANGLFGR